MEGEDKTLVAVEIDFQIFSQSIWKEISSKYFKSIKKERSKLNSSVVWAEIFSIIKGSVKAHTTHLKCLSPSMYLE
jgi:superfamily I DNA/RNA helicase